MAEGGNGSGIGCGRVLFVYYSPLPPRRYEQHVQRRCGRRTWWFFWLVGRGVVQVEGEARVAEPWLRITRRRAFRRRLPPSSRIIRFTCFLFYDVYITYRGGLLLLLLRCPGLFFASLQAFVLSRPEMKLSKFSVAASQR